MLSYLQPEEQGCGIIMEVTLLLLIGPFYYIALYWGYKIMKHTVHKPNHMFAQTEIYLRHIETSKSKMKLISSEHRK